eukprot:gene130-biopygen185
MYMPPTSPGIMGDLGDLVQIDEVEHGVRGRLGEDQLRVRPDGVLDRVQVTEIDEGEPRRGAIGRKLRGARRRTRQCILTFRIEEARPNHTVRYDKKGRHGPQNPGLDIPSCDPSVEMTTISTSLAPSYEGTMPLLESEAPENDAQHSRRYAELFPEHTKSLRHAEGHELLAADAVRAAVGAVRNHHVVAGVHEAGHDRGGGGHARADERGAIAALKLRHLLLVGRHCRIRGARVRVT